MKLFYYRPSNALIKASIGLDWRILNEQMRNICSSLCYKSACRCYAFWFFSLECRLSFLFKGPTRTSSSQRWLGPSWRWRWSLRLSCAKLPSPSSLTWCSASSTSPAASSEWVLTCCNLWVMSQNVSCCSQAVLECRNSVNLFIFFYF